MKFITNIFAIILFFILFTGCSFNLKLLNNKKSQLERNNDIYSYLALNYLNYAHELSNEYNWKLSDFFAKKGLKILENKYIYPEAAENWNIKITQIEEMTYAREKIIILLKDKYLPSKQTKSLANLILLYDCWITSAHNEYYLEKIAKCKIGFFDLMKELERLKLQYEEIARKEDEMKRMKMKPLPQIEFTLYKIYFEFDKYQINKNEEKKIVKLLSHLANLNGKYKLLIVGNTDRSGKKLYNQRLAYERAKIVKNILIKNGVPRRLVTIRPMGEINPIILTKDNKKAKINRRTDIYILEGAENIDVKNYPLYYIKEYIEKKELQKIILSP